MSKQKKLSSSRSKEVVFVMQGGGALGAYQVGLVEALTENGYKPDWIVGTSIGAINSSLFAGNAPSVRIDKLKQFWDIVTRSTFPLLTDDEITRRIHNFWSAQLTLYFGQSGFFSPRWSIPWLNTEGTPATASFYDTSELRNTLEQLIDFERINYGETRLSLGAVEVQTGKLVYFDNKEQKIGPEHIMASGALPPGFPAVEIDGKMYWDGGISSNTPVAHVIRCNIHSDHTMQKHFLCFMMQVFDSYGLLPCSIDDVLRRKKDISFSSRYFHEISLHGEIHRLRHVIQRLIDEIPGHRKSDPEIKNIIGHNESMLIDLVRFQYQHKATDLFSKDFEFSKQSIVEHMQAGYRDALVGIAKSPWLKPRSENEGIILHDFGLHEDTGTQ